LLRRSLEHIEAQRLLQQPDPAEILAKQVDRAGQKIFIRDRPVRIELRLVLRRQRKPPVLPQDGIDPPLQVPRGREDRMGEAADFPPDPLHPASYSIDLRL